jgi:transposase-like protein
MEGGRRRWSALQKAAIVTESLADGTRVSEVAEVDPIGWTGIGVT